MEKGEWEKGILDIIFSFHFQFSSFYYYYYLEKYVKKEVYESAMSECESLTSKKESEDFMCVYECLFWNLKLI